MMNKLSNRHLTLLFLFLALPALACGIFGDSSIVEPPRNAVVVDVMANKSLITWLEPLVADFNASEIENSDSKPIFVTLNPVEAGQAISQLADVQENPSIWIPDSDEWVDILADQGNANFSQDCVSVAESPLVIGMWRPVAESLGWPGLPLGWLDIGSLAADPNAWAYYSGGDYGNALRLSHAHPGLTGSGTSTLLAVVQAAQSKTNRVTTDDISQPIVQASVGAFESAVTSFNPDTASLGRTMSERGPEFLGAAILYESNIIEQGNSELVAIYPLEGTFMATHPACINEVSEPNNAEAAAIFRDFLTSAEAQSAALAAGLRPINPAVPMGPPIVPANGVNAEQPQRIFESPTADTVYAIQELWQSARRPVNLVMLLDTSGSMDGSKIENMKEAAAQFVEQMGDEDTISIVEFYTVSDLLVDQAQVGPNREQIIELIGNMESGGETTLFDAIGDGSAVVANSSTPESSNAMIILTDGQDTASTRFSFDDRLISTATDNDTTIYTVAYGNDADEELLATLAARGQGNFYQGDIASIAAIYEEMSAAFGGSLGVGR
ncbi:MAG: substrate-binding domain-containing protein [Candidatus Promineifilaceae bacterium]|nr:substrate-binding domain-containing protein [Candidatus Promineifilaceae bacterium]